MPGDAYVVDVIIRPRLRRASKRLDVFIASCPASSAQSTTHEAHSASDGVGHPLGGSCPACGGMFFHRGDCPYRAVFIGVQP
jgi:hypothetical protein